MHAKKLDFHSPCLTELSTTLLEFLTRRNKNVLFAKKNRSLLAKDAKWLVIVARSVKRKTGKHTKKFAYRVNKNDKYFFLKKQK